MAYTMRHSCASWLVSEGLPTRLVADFLGTSEKMIIDHYGHLAPDYQEEAALAIGRSLKKAFFWGGELFLLCHKRNRVAGRRGVD